jgi:phage-related minor tail protein
MGNPYLVGERGPELFIPGASGHVTETSSLATKSGSSNVIAALDRLNNTMNVVASNTGNNAQTEALSAQLATLRALVTTAKQSYRVSRDIRDYTV